MLYQFQFLKVKDLMQGGELDNNSLFFCIYNKEVIAIKNIIEYFYKISNLELHRKGDFYYFTLEPNDYLFIPLARTELELLEINQIIKDDLLYDQLVLNIENHYLTQTQKGYFVLIRKSRANFSLEQSIIQEKSRILSTTNYVNIDRTNWKDLWSKKIDYIEYQLLHIESRYPLISKSINYYIGMTETAISYLNDFYSKNAKMGLLPTISHKRILKDNFNSPMNIITDYRARDISEYLKYLFIENTYNYDKISIFLKKCELTETDSQLIYARLLYPSFYFDLYDQIVSGLIEEKKILPLLSRSKEYEDFVRMIYSLLNEKQTILKAGWI